MGHPVDPARLTESGEQCLLRLGRLPSLRLPTGQLITVIGTVVEGHVSRILARLIVLSHVDSIQLGQALLDEQLDSMNDSWPKRNRWLKAGFDLDHAGYAPYQDFDLLVQARNAVVHGDGALTDRQRRDGTRKIIQLRNDLLAKLDITLRGQLRYGPDSAERALRVAREFVVDFDARVIRKHPQARTL